MCGINAVVRRRSTREPVSIDELTSELLLIQQLLESADVDLGSKLEQAADRLQDVDRALQGVPGLVALLSDQNATETVRRTARRLDEVVSRIEEDLDHPLSGST